MNPEITQHVANSGTGHEVIQKLVVIIACYAVLAFAGSRRWLRPLELVLIGVAMIFWAAGWLLQTLIPKVAIPIYGPGWHALLFASALTFPMVLAMAVGLWLLVRRMERNPPPPPEPAKNRPKKGRGGK